VLASPPTPFDRVLESPIPLPPLRVRSLAELILRGPAGEPDEAPILLGALESQALTVTLRRLRHAVLSLSDDFAARGLAAGDTVCLVRLPRTSETVCAVAYAALSAAGLRVLFPMYLELDDFAGWLGRAGARAVLWSAAEVEAHGTEADRDQLAGLTAAAARLGVPTVCLCRDLALPALLAAEHPASPAADDSRVAALCARDALDAECLLLTTSGTSGRAKLVRYRQRALLASCASWEAAGLFQPELLGGRALTLLLAHSMGVRAFWNAVWTRQPLCLITPEWFLERPEWVRALLMTMRPQHITGGPAAYRALLELMRVFPEVKQTCLKDLRCAVSTGAPYDPELARRLRTALGLELHNAFGTTETMQVASTLLGEADARRERALGAPLPGVKVALARHAGYPEPVYRLFVSSPAACSGYLDGAAPPATPEEWRATGDLLEEAGGSLRFVGREETDFVKDGFGVKVPLARVAAFYADLGAPVTHLELFPLHEEPGLAALLFVTLDAAAAAERAVPLEDRTLLDRVQTLLEQRHEQLREELEEFEFRHLTAARFACVAGACPRTAKGTPDRGAILRGLGALVERLTGPYVKRPGLVLLERESYARSRQVRLTSPRRGELLRAARLDKQFVAGRGDRLLYREQGREVEVVDFVGGFGANLLGHRHPDVVAAATAYLAGDGVPLLDQGSARPHEGALARALGRLLSREAGVHPIVRFASTGAEAVEMALAHAWLERDERFQRLCREQRRLFGHTHGALVAEQIARNEARLRDGRPKVLALEGGFHGHTLGARSALHGKKQREPFRALLALDALFVSPDGEGDLDELLAREELPLEMLVRHGDRVEHATAPFSRIVAAIAEAIQGEGGVREVDPWLLRRLAAQPFPLILDEIQAGLGRSGELLASRGVRGGTYVFSKTLGGGVAKIAAVCVDRRRYVQRFDELYASTFAGDGFSCTIARRVLEIIERDDVPGRARARGQALRGAIDEVAAEFPDVIAAVRGRGLMLGVELSAGPAQDSMLIRALIDRELYGSLAGAWLLNRHRVRVLPTLSAPRTLRLEPSAWIDDAAIAQLAAGLRGFAQAVRARDFAALLSFLVEEEAALTAAPAGEAPIPHRDCRLPPPAPEAIRVGFLNHFVYPERELVMVEPSLAALSVTARRALFHKLIMLTEQRPIAAFAENLYGGRVHFTSFPLVTDVATLEDQHRTGQRQRPIERVQDAVDLAGRLGCQVIALGAFTSILTRDGTALLAPPGARLTSGNSFTVVVGARRLLAACAARGVEPAVSRLAIVGATGNIGTGLSFRLALGAPAFAEVMLVGRSRPRLDELQARILARHPAARVTVSTELTALREAQVVAVATNTNEPLVYPHHLAPAGRVLVADLAVPSAVAAEVAKLPHVAVVTLAGSVLLPHDRGFVLSSHTRPGTVFSCAAEAILLALEPRRTAGLRLVGDIDPHTVEVLDGLATEHGLLDTIEEGGFRS
jgi:acetylornithine/succinyldiaminopimelate/putrescine aminotransferase/predicted amino acid dehydrogenase/acyl-CoA synthetase (AMP-forming)/AMP-acid ligase II